MVMVFFFVSIIISVTHTLVRKVYLTLSSYALGLPVFPP